MKNLKEHLRELGFTENEASVYTVVLELNEALPSAISRKARVNRSTTYGVLSDLEIKGVVSRVKRNKHIYFQALDPAFFLKWQESRQANLKGSLEELKVQLPTLFAMHKDAGVTPQMSVFRGKAGLIQIMEDTLKTSTEILCWAAPETVFGLLKDYYPRYIKKKVARKIKLRGIFCYDKIALDFKHRSKEELREIYLIPKEDFPFKNEINIYDDKVAIISHEDQVGVIIQNQHIADTQRAIFNFAFKYAKKEEEILMKQLKS